MVNSDNVKKSERRLTETLFFSKLFWISYHDKLTVPGTLEWTRVNGSTSI